MINTRTLACSNCGSAQFHRLEKNEFKCLHCGSVTLVEDDVAQRLEQILQRMQRPHSTTTSVLDKRATFIVMMILAGTIGLVSMVGSFLLRAKRNSVNPVVSIMPQPINSDELKIEGLKEVGKPGSSDRYLIAMAHNTSNQVMYDATIIAAMYDEDGNKQTTWPGSHINVSHLMPGERAPLKITLRSFPNNKIYNRYEIDKKSFDPLFSYTGRAELSLTKYQLIEKNKEYFFIGTLKNADKVSAKYPSVSVTLFDKQKNIIGMGNAVAESDILTPLQSTYFKVPCLKFDDGEVDSYEYIIDSQKAESTSLLGGNTTHPKNTLVSINQPNIRKIESTSDLSTQELLDDKFAFFDNAKLSLTKLRQLPDEAHQPIVLTELTNTSQDTIVLNPGLTIQFFNAGKRIGIVNQIVAPYLYPGERLPLKFSVDFESAYTDYKVIWSNMKGKPLPGSRPKLHLTVDHQEAKLGSVLFNYTNNYIYKYVDFTGFIENLDNRRVENIALRIALYDKQGIITGYGEEKLESMYLKPGDKIPYQISANQYGGDFFRYEITYRENKDNRF